MRAEKKTPASKIHSLFLNATRRKKGRGHFIESEIVNAMIKQLKINSPNVYVHIDRDSGNVRHTSSGWDFLLCYEGRIVFFECKVGKNSLSDWQKLTRVEVTRAGARFVVLRFPAHVSDLKDFTISREDRTQAIHVENVNAEWLSAL